MKLICYCFNYTYEDIKKDLLENGRSTIMEMIIKEKQFGGCSCHTKNPSGK
ncbi:MAG: hypothetical protein GY714_28365 [Desulfobacterales bacterium]|nr:hypothetical protein [Desulfobacterales bacterium]MCP4161889.1 hypothetical protein [Deltaproteobacteria bacterium]